MDNSDSVVGAVGAGLFGGIRHQQPDSPVTVGSTYRTGVQPFIGPSRIKAGSERGERHSTRFMGGSSVSKHIAARLRANRGLKGLPAET